MLQKLQDYAIALRTTFGNVVMVNHVDSLRLEKTIGCPLIRLLKIHRQNT
jgi:hypothetical protein